MNKIKNAPLALKNAVKLLFLSLGFQIYYFFYLLLFQKLSGNNAALPINSVLLFLSMNGIIAFLYLRILSGARWARLFLVMLTLFNLLPNKQIFAGGVFPLAAYLLAIGTNAYAIYVCFFTEIKTHFDQEKPEIASTQNA